MLKISCISLLTLFCASSFAHSGGTNAAGCHYDHKNGGYHCHRSEDQDTKTLREPTSENSDAISGEDTERSHQTGKHKKKKRPHKN